MASSFLKWRGHLDTLIFRLKLHQTFFYLEILELLRLAGVSEVHDFVDLTADECVAILTDVKTGKHMREHLGPLYHTCLEILARYESCLRTIVGKIGHIQRLPKVPTDLSYSLSVDSYPCLGTRGVRT